MDEEKPGRSSALKGQDAPAEIILVDPVTLPIAKLLAGYKVSPITLAVLAFIFRLIGAVCFIANELPLGAAASIGGFYLDGIDGKVARIRHIDEKLHGTVDFLLDQLAFALMGIAALVWAIHTKQVASATLIGGWLALYMVLMAFTSTWFRILSEHSKVFQYGVGKEALDSALTGERQGPIESLLARLRNLFMLARAKLARYRMQPYFGTIESEVVIFMIAPFFRFNPVMLVFSLIFLLPDTLIMATLSLLMVSRKRQQ